MATMGDQIRDREAEHRRAANWLKGTGISGEQFASLPPDVIPAVAMLRAEIKELKEVNSALDHLKGTCSDLTDKVNDLRAQLEEAKHRTVRCHCCGKYFEEPGDHECDEKILGTELAQLKDLRATVAKLEGELHGKQLTIQDQSKELGLLKAKIRIFKAGRVIPIPSVTPSPGAIADALVGAGHGCNPVEGPNPSDKIEEQAAQIERWRKFEDEIIVALGSLGTLPSEIVGKVREQAAEIEQLRDVLRMVISEEEYRRLGFYLAVLAAKGE